VAVNPKNSERFEQSTNLFIRALELDPSYSQAYAALSMAYNLDYQNRWSDDPDNSLELAKYNAERAIEKDPNEPFARLVASWSAMFEKDLDRAKSEADIALSLNPNFSGAYASLGSIHTYSGRPLEAIPALEHATRLDPAFRSGHLHFLSMACLLAGKYDTAVALLKERIRLIPGTDFSRVLLASALGHLGEVDEAHRIWKELKEINPKYSFSQHFGRQPFKREEDVQRIAEGLAKAGLST
jgi:adenylate cyclase